MDHLRPTWATQLETWELLFFVCTLNFNRHTKSLVQCCFVQIRNIARDKPMTPKPQLNNLSTPSTPPPMQLFTCLNDGAVARLQLVRDAAARFLTNTNHKHITPVLAELLRPSICLGIPFKLPVITLESQLDLAPLNISEPCSPSICT